MAPPTGRRETLQRVSKGKRPAPPAMEGGKRRRVGRRAVSSEQPEERAPTAESDVRPAFEPAVEDSAGRYGDIAYAKSWCGFEEPRRQTAIYSAWREEIKAYITARSWDPSRLTDSQVESVMDFARSRPPVRQRVALVEAEHHADDVGELLRHLRILVKDTAKKLQASRDRLKGERASGGGEVNGPQMAQADWTSPYRPRAVRIHIVRRTDALDIAHPFLGHPWCAIDSDRGIAWGVLGAPSITNLLGVVRGQRVEEEIRYPRYLIGASGEGASALRRAPEEPLPLRQLIFLNRDEDIRAWLLANDNRHPLDLLVLESRPDQGEEEDLTPEPANRRYPFFDREVWDRSGEAKDAVGAMQEEEDHAEEWEEAEGVGSSEAPGGTGESVVIDDNDEEPGAPGPSTGGTRSQRSTEPDPGPSEPSAPAGRRSPRDVLFENPWLEGSLTEAARPAARRPWYDGAQDSRTATPPAFRDGRPASPPVAPTVAPAPPEPLAPPPASPPPPPENTGASMPVLRRSARRPRGGGGG